MKKVFRSHPFLVTGGRFATLFMMIVPFMGLVLFYSLYVFHNTFYGVSEIALLIFGTALLVGMNVLGFSLVIRYLWRVCWEKVIITDTHVIWRCLFCRPVKIALCDVNAIAVLVFKEGNVMYHRDTYHTGYQYLCISDSYVPNPRVDKIRTKQGLIKVMHNKTLEKTLRKAVKEAKYAQDKK